MNAYTHQRAQTNNDTCVRCKVAENVSQRTLWVYERTHQRAQMNTDMCVRTQIDKCEANKDLGMQG